MKRCVPAASHIHLRIFYTRCRLLTRLPRMAGDRYLCPCCGHRFRRFFADGLQLPVFAERKIVSGAYTENARCPWCWSSERDRLLYLYLSRCLRAETPWTVLHLAPEPPLQRFLRAKPGVLYIAGDLQSPLATARMDVLRLPLRSASVDWILCSHVLEHVLDDRKAMHELFRVLKPGGWAILQVPIGLAVETTYEDPAITRPEDRERAFGQFDHVRIYAQADYRRRLESVGFQVRAENALALFGAEEVDGFRLNPLEDVHFCRKPAQAPPRPMNERDDG
ncbi:MAG: methyltransferase domain-containing protein [Candidatus Omnitrophica bacterium]|nr:methyltransferase domain-containing protein [Candidatus Omnitrophota bacterium]